MNLDNEFFCDDEKSIYVGSAELLVDLHNISNIQYSTKR